MPWIQPVHLTNSGASCHVFEGHSDSDEDQKRDGFQATYELEKGRFLWHRSADLFELREE
jgi:hypothetical protein